jgi:hypothetical protein
MKNKEYLNIVFNKLYLVLKSYDLAAKDLHLVNDTLKFILNSDNILRDLFVLSSVNKFGAFVNYVLFIIKKIEEEKINYGNLSYNIDSDTKFLEKEIINYFSVEPKKITEREIKKTETVKPVIKNVHVEDEFIDETIAEFYGSADEETDNIITDENYTSGRNKLELVEVDRSEEDINEVFNLPETGLTEEVIQSEIPETINENTTEGDINDFNYYDEQQISEGEFKSEAEKFSEDTYTAEYDTTSISEEKEKLNTADSSYWDIPEEELQEETKADLSEEVIEEEIIEVIQETTIIAAATSPEITEEVTLTENISETSEEEKEKSEEIKEEKELVQQEMNFDAPELNESNFKEEIAEKPEEKNGEDLLPETKEIVTEDKKSIEDFFEEKPTEEKSEEKIKEQKEETIEEANEEFIEYENYVLRTNGELKYDFERMMEFAKRLNKNYEERNIIIKEVIDKTSFLENCSRELSLEVITNIYETFKLSFEKISDGKYDLSEETLTIFIESLQLIESLLKGDDYLTYDSLIKSLDKLRKSLQREKKQKAQAEQKQNEEKSTENLLSNLYPDEHKLFIANNIRKKISDIEKIFNSLNDIESNYVQIEALTILNSNLSNFKELVGYANTIQLASLAKVAEGGYILIKYLQNYRKDPTEEIWKETFKYIIYVMRLLVINKPVEDLDLFISYLNEPIKIYLSKEK